MSGGAVGFDRALRLDWLDRAASLALAGAARAEAQRELQGWLLDRIAGQEAATKTALVLARVWFPADAARLRLRDEAAALLPAVEATERRALHWSVLLAAYPFFRDTTAVLGRLLRLQPTVTALQVRRRLIEMYGDRAYVERARRHVVQTLVWQGALEMVDRRGTFALGSVTPVRRSEVERVVLQAQVLTSVTGAAQLDGLLGAPELFPFAFAHQPSVLVQHASFALSTVAGDQRLVSLAR